MNKNRVKIKHLLTTVHSVVGIFLDAGKIMQKNIEYLPSWSIKPLWELAIIKRIQNMY